MSREDEHGHTHIEGDPIRGVDLTLATLLLLELILGTVGNITSQFFFWSQKHRKPNRSYFKRIYQIICGVDFIICITLIPVIEAFLKDHSEVPVLFGTPWFCTVWGLVWEVLPSISVFLVAILSISRLVLLLKPTVQLKSSVFVLLMSSYLIITVAVKCALLLSSNKMVYWKTTRCCVMVYDDPTSKALELDFDGNQLKTTAVMMVQLVLPIFPVALSFCFTMVALYRARHTSNRIQSSCKTQSRAGVTVVIVTLVYIFFNLPVVIHFGFILHCVAVKIDDVCHYETIYPSIFFYYYMWPFMYVVCVGLNSTLNPLVYWLRMTPFRGFVLRLIRLS